MTDHADIAVIQETLTEHKGWFERVFIALDSLRNEVSETRGRRQAALWFIGLVNTAALALGTYMLTKVSNMNANVSGIHETQEVMKSQAIDMKSDLMSFMAQPRYTPDLAERKIFESETKTKDSYKADAAAAAAFNKTQIDGLDTRVKAIEGKDK